MIEFKSAGRIAGSNSRVKLRVKSASRNSWFKFLGRIAGENCWGKLPCNAKRYTRNARRYTERTQANAANPWPSPCQPRSTHGRAYAWPENGQGRAGKRQRKGPQRVRALCGLNCDELARLNYFGKLAHLAQISPFLSVTVPSAFSVNHPPHSTNLHLVLILMSGK